MTDTATRGETERSGDAVSPRGGDSPPEPPPAPSAPSSRPRGPRYGASSGTIVKIALLGLVNAVVIAALPTAFAKPDYPIAIASIVALVVIDIVYLSRRRWSIPLKYLLPGTIFLLVFALYPILYLVYISTTNYGTGNNLTKEQVIERIESNSVSASDDAIRYDLQILAAGDPNGELAFLLTDDAGDVFLGTADDFVPVAPDDLVEQGTRLSVDGYVALNLGQANDRSAEISAFSTEGPQARSATTGSARRSHSSRPASTTRPPTRSPTRSPAPSTPRKAATSPTTTATSSCPGWRASVGLDNYERLITDERNPRLVRARVRLDDRVLADVGAAVVRPRPHARARVQRRQNARPSLVPQPDHHPVRDSELHDRARLAGMLNQQFGVINRWLGTNLPWLDGDWLPYFSILLVNTWLGYPYMFLVCSGALQSIPEDLNEAASVDGASGIKRFRLITLPLLFVAVAPLLVASFAFNFNNFNLIFLLTEGTPADPGQHWPAGPTSSSPTCTSWRSRPAAPTTASLRRSPW
jgi:arabinogalactan oligomer / maltooligosaccharide transport system permease protein